MQELAKDLIEATELLSGDPTESLKRANEKWTSFVIKHNVGDALKWGLEISRNIAEYINCIED